MIRPKSNSEAPRRPEAIAGLRRQARAALRLIYPPLCIACQAPVSEEGVLCPDCWPRTGFIRGLSCETCGAPLPGQSDRIEQCDACLRTPPPWDKARAALRYDGTARAMILGFKHGDRTELARPFGRWMAEAGRDILDETCLLVPVPLHRFRLIRRKYNQAALLAQALARETGGELCVDLLRRIRMTPPQEGLDRKQRAENVAGVFALHPKRADRAKGRKIVLIDDVMTSGATLRAAYDAVRPLDAPKIYVLCLARVAKDP
ncbi:ComF family protein [Thioclava sp. GXIMD4216]|uniref:ComF family protein n=1 Tax=Thioclava litoralis TaxID=3076557 RepID=A0ABZ1E2B8_9RHOB|nr:ComF family protein [Thioclava sp. FTW29]